MLYFLKQNYCFTYIITLYHILFIIICIYINQLSILPLFYFIYHVSHDYFTSLLL